MKTNKKCIASPRPRLSTWFLVSKLQVAPLRDLRVPPSYFECGKFENQGFRPQLNNMLVF